jgi:hypothetical protein
MLQLLGKDLLLVKQPVLFFGQDLHLLYGGPQDGCARVGGDGFGYDVREAGEKIDVVLIVIVLHVVVDFQHAERAVIASDDDIDGRNDPVLGVVGWQIEIVVSAQVVTDRRFAGDEGAPLRRAFVSAQGDLADDAGMPAVSSFNQKIVVLGAVSAYLAKWRAKAFRADPRGLGRTLNRLFWRRAKLPKPATAACWRRKLRTCSTISLMRAFSSDRRGQHLESVRKRLRNRSSCGHVSDDFQTAQQVVGDVGFGEAAMAVDGGQMDLRSVPRGVKDSEMGQPAQSGGDLGAETTIGEPQVKDGEVGFVALTEFNPLGNGPSDATHLVAVFDKYLFDHVGYHQVVFGDQNLQHA